MHGATFKAPCSALPSPFPPPRSSSPCWARPRSETRLSERSKRSSGPARLTSRRPAARVGSEDREALEDCAAFRARPVTKAILEARRTVLRHVTRRRSTSPGRQRTPRPRCSPVRHSRLGSTRSVRRSSFTTRPPQRSRARRTDLARPAPAWACPRRRAWARGRMPCERPACRWRSGRHLRLREPSTSDAGSTWRALRRRAPRRTSSRSPS